MSDWKIVGKEETPGSKMIDFLTCGFAGGTHKYTIENEDTGETKEVITTTEERLGKKIANGDI
jgi:hypothetical protein